MHMRPHNPTHTLPPAYLALTFRTRTETPILSAVGGLSEFITNLTMACEDKETVEDSFQCGVAYFAGVCMKIT